jgi:3-hydroxyacyl-[acyl-carrier-protein] dehydratase
MSASRSRTKPSPAKGVREVVTPPDLLFASPLRAIDRISVEARNSGLTLYATKTIHAMDPYLSGHFPEFIIYPGVFIIEGLRQAVAAALGESEGRLPEITALPSIRFLAPLFPGDTMTLEATLKQISEGAPFEVCACCRRNDGVTVAQLRVEFGY